MSAKSNSKSKDSGCTRRPNRGYISGPRVENNGCGTPRPEELPGQIKNDDACNLSNGGVQEHLSLPSLTIEYPDNTHCL